MKPTLTLVLTLAAIGWLAGCGSTETGNSPKTTQPAGTAASDGAGLYEYRRPSRDGTGKFYMGREISHVMGHLGAEWLERPSRQREERTDLLIRNLPLTPNSIVADIGAGTGYFTFQVAPKVPQGKVLAVDIQPEMLALIQARRSESGQANVDTILGTVSNPNLPASQVDLVLLVDAYHEFSHPYEMGAAMAQALRPGGLLILIEYRGEDPSVPIKRLHKMTEKQAIAEMRAVGLHWLRTQDFLPQQHFMVFEKPVDQAAAFHSTAKDQLPARHGEAYRIAKKGLPD